MLRLMAEVAQRQRFLSEPMKKNTLDYRSFEGDKRGGGLWTAFAIAGVAVIICGAIVLLLAFARHSARVSQPAPRVACSSHLREIGGYVQRYEQDHQGHLPDDLTTLARDGYLEDGYQL